MCFIISQPSPWPLRCERTQNGEFAALAVGVVVQPHHAEHPAARLVDGDEGHGVRRIVMDELVDQLGADFAHRRKEAQPQILRASPRQGNRDKARRPPAAAAGSAPSRRRAVMIVGDPAIAPFVPAGAPGPGPSSAAVLETARHMGPRLRGTTRLNATSAPAPSSTRSMPRVTPPSTNSRSREWP